MLNPDGVDYQIHGISKENPLFERAFVMNGKSLDFSHWQANARGVDLNHNYNAGFREYKQLEAEEQIPCGAPTRYSGQEPESEPEVKAICQFIRFQKDLRLVMTFHTQGEEIYYQSDGKFVEKSMPAIFKLSDLMGYRLTQAEGLAAYGGLTDWCLQKQNVPALTIECGKGVNPLPQSDATSIYHRLREGFFTAPTLF
jgi:g-D-glutamyl-meso-diaminopimelate peptidase